MASTFTTGFGIEKIGSGEQSGAWGTTTNHNLDILDRIASFKAVGLSGTTHTLTVREVSPGSGTENLQDGMYRVIKFTGALGANNTVTIAPNTAPAYFIFENATTASSGGPYSVILTQGSGANVTIQNGKNAIVYCDGLGGGAAVVNALSDLQIATLEVTGVAALDGAVTVGGASQFNSTVTVGVNDTGYDVKLFGATSGKSLLWDESADSLIVTGTTTLVGTTNLDAVDIDGATQIDATLSVGVNDTGYDVKFFGDTASAYMLWDTSADDLILGGAANLGIGIAPAARLHIKQAANSTNNGFRTERSDTTGHSVIYMGGDDDLYIQNQANGDINWYTNAAQKMTLKADGKLGISTAAPQGRLDILGNSDSVVAFRIGANADFGWNFYDSSTNGDLIVKSEQSGTQTETFRLPRAGGLVLTGSNNALLAMKTTGDTASNVMGTQYLNNSGAVTAQTFATGDNSSGNVFRIKGIGHVDLIGGDIGVTGAAPDLRVQADGNVAIGSATAPGKLYVKKSSTVEAVLGTATNGHLFKSQSDDNTDGFEIYQQHGTNTTRESFVVNDNRTGSKSTAFSIRGDGRVFINPVTGFRAPTGSLLVQTTLANIANVFYMFKVAQVEMTMGFKASTDTNFYVGTGSQTIGTNGVYLTNTATQWTHNSDFRVKKNLVPIEDALDKIANCRAVTGHYKHEDDDVKRRPFLIAQDWVTALPEAVDEDTVDDDGVENLGLSYEGTVPLLVAAIKELREQNIALTNRITSLEG